MGYIYNRETDDFDWVDEGDQPLSPMEQAIINGNQGDLLQATDEYYGSAQDPNSRQTGPNSWVNGTINIDEHPPVNWGDPNSYNYLINTPGGTPPPGTPPTTPSGNTGGNTGGTGGNTGGTGGNTGGGSWFNGGGGSPSANFGAVPAPFGDTYTAAQRPDYLQGEYKPPVWGERYQALTADELASDPGYQNRLQETQRGLERSAAAKGKILSGGFIGRALPRELGALASQEYTAANDRKFNQYQQRYGAFLDAAGLGNQARTTNENAYQSDVGTGLNQYLARFNAYQTAIGNTRNAQGDLWSRNMDLARNSLTAAGLARP